MLPDDRMVLEIRSLIIIAIPPSQGPRKYPTIPVAIKPRPTFNTCGSPTENLPKTTWIATSIAVSAMLRVVSLGLVQEKSLLVMLIISQKYL